MLTVLVIVALCSWFLIEDGKTFTTKLIVICIVGGLWYYFNSDYGATYRNNFLDWLNSF